MVHYQNDQINMNGSQDITSKKTATSLTGGIPGIPAETYQAFNSVENPVYVAPGNKVRNRGHALTQLWSSPVLQRIKTKASSKSVFVSFAFAMCLMAFFVFIESYHAPESVLGEEQNPNMVLYSPSQPFPFDFINDLAISLDNPIAPITPIDSRVPEDAWPGDASKKDSIIETLTPQHGEFVAKINTEVGLLPGTQEGSSSVDTSGRENSGSDVQLSEPGPRSIEYIESSEAKVERESDRRNEQGVAEARAEAAVGQNHPASDSAKQPDDNLEETDQSGDAGKQRNAEPNKPVDDNEEETNQLTESQSQPQGESQRSTQVGELLDNVDSAESQAQTSQGDDSRDSPSSVSDNSEESQNRDNEDSSRAIADISQETNRLDESSGTQNESEKLSAQGDDTGEETSQIGNSRLESDENVGGANQAGESRNLVGDNSEERNEPGNAHAEQDSDERAGDTQQKLDSGQIEGQEQEEVSTRITELQQSNSRVMEDGASKEGAGVDPDHQDDRQRSIYRGSGTTKISSESAPNSPSSRSPDRSITLSSSTSSATGPSTLESGNSSGKLSSRSSDSGALLSLSPSGSAPSSSGKTTNLSGKKLIPKVPVLTCRGNHSKVRVSLPASVKSQPWRQVIFVFSHRRSGTHATVEFLQEQFQTRAKIFKINDHSPADHHMGCDALAWYRRYGRIIYVHRDPADTLVSMWHYLKNYAFDSHQMVNLTDYIRERNLFSLGMCPSMEYKFQCLRKPASKDSKLRELNRVQYLRYHRESWARYPDVFRLNFKDLMDNPETALAKIEEFFGIERSNRGKIGRPKPSIKTVFYRGGKSDASKELSSEDLEWLYEQYEAPLPEGLLHSPCCANTSDVDFTAERQRRFEKHSHKALQ